MDTTTNSCNFDFWTGEENSLVQKRGSFALAVNFAEREVDEYVYEYDKMLENILNLSEEYIHTGQGMEMHSLVEFNINKQFVLVRRDHRFVVKLIGQYDTNEEVINMIKIDQLTLEKGEFHYVVIDLADTSPWFFKLGALTKPGKKALTKSNTESKKDNSDESEEEIVPMRLGTFYSGKPKKLIKF